MGQSLRVLVADDQIPPDEPSDDEIREEWSSKYGEDFTRQCLFMREIVHRLGDLGYRVTTARKYDDAKSIIEGGEFDMAIIDLGWFFDDSLPNQTRGSAGWSLCDALDEQDGRTKRKTPRILFSSRFPSDPGLSRDAARRQALPIFKEPTETSREALMAAVSFVDATLVSQSSPGSGSDFKEQLEEIALKFFEEPLRDYRRWTSLTLVSVAVSIVLVLAGVALAIAGKTPVYIITSIGGAISGWIAKLLYDRMDRAQKAMETAQQEVLKRLETRAEPIAAPATRPADAPDVREVTAPKSPKPGRPGSRR